MRNFVSRWTDVVPLSASLFVVGAAVFAELPRSGSLLWVSVVASIALWLVQPLRQWDAAARLSALAPTSSPGRKDSRA